MSKPLDLTGQRFGRLIVLERVENDKYGSTRWKCECDCGNIIIVSRGHLKDGSTRSCGCLQKENRKLSNTIHGGRYTRLYTIWSTMKTRCNNINNKNYGGKGIKVCKEWNDSFEVFQNWALSNNYSEELSLDRIDNNLGYQPDNCRWVTMQAQQNNRTNNHYITYNNKTQTLAQWAREYEINYDVFEQRINKLKWSIEKALTTPVKVYK